MIKYVCGIDVGSQSCAGCVCRPDKSLVGKPMTTALGKEGWDVLLDKLSHLDALPQEILIGMEATARYSENLYHALEQYGYRLCLLHPGQTHQFHKRQGLRAKTDRLDAMTIARVLLSGEARSGYIPSERVATYRELVRLHSQLSEQAARCQNQIHALVVVLFPEFTQVFADPCLPTALAVLKVYRSRASDGPGEGRGALARSEARPLWASDRQEAAAPGLDFGQQRSSRSGALGESAPAV